MAEKKNPQNERILRKYKEYLTDEEKYFLENDGLVHPRYRTSKPVGRFKGPDGKDEGPIFDVSYAPEFKENSMNMRSRDRSGGAGRGFVNPKNASATKKKAGGVVKKRRDGIAQRGKTKGRMC